MIKKFISYYKPHWKLFTIDMLCSLLVAICDLFYPIIAKDIINDYVPNQNIRLLVVWSIALVAIYLLKAVLNFIIQYWGHIVGVRIQGDMRKEMFEHLQKLPFSFFDENKTGTIMSRLINDLQDISELAHHGPEDIFIATITLLGSCALMIFSVNPYLALISFSVVPIIVVYAIITRKNMRNAFKKTREETAVINAQVESSVSGIRVSKAYTTEVYENEKFEACNGAFKKAKAGQYKQMGIFGSGMTFFTDFLYLLALISGGIFYSKGRFGKTVKGMSQIPVVNSEVVTACALVMLFMLLSVNHRSVVGLYIGHILLSAPFVVLSVTPKLKQMDSSLYEAALDLGATPMQALFKVILPEILPGIFTGFMLAITLSLDDYIITATLSPLGYDTISTAVYKAIALTTEKASEKVPIYRALTTIIFLATVTVVIIINLRANRKAKEQRL